MFLYLLKWSITNWSSHLSNLSFNSCTKINQNVGENVAYKISWWFSEKRDEIGSCMQFNFKKLLKPINLIDLCFWFIYFYFYIFFFTMCNLLYSNLNIIILVIFLDFEFLVIYFLVLMWLLLICDWFKFHCWSISDPPYISFKMLRWLKQWKKQDFQPSGGKFIFK